MTARANNEQLAIQNGIDIDEKFRNENGIDLQMRKLKYVFTGGTSGLAVKMDGILKVWIFTKTIQSNLNCC